jgi:hypothetical protein
MRFIIEFHFLMIGESHKNLDKNYIEKYDNQIKFFDITFISRVLEDKKTFYNRDRDNYLYIDVYAQVMSSKLSA